MSATWGGRSTWGSDPQTIGVGIQQVPTSENFVQKSQSNLSMLEKQIPAWAIFSFGLVTVAPGDNVFHIVAHIA